MPVSATANSIQPRPSTPVRFTFSDTFAALGELEGIAQQVEQDLAQPHGVDDQDAEVARIIDGEPVALLLGQLARGADHVVDQWR